MARWNRTGSATVTNGSAAVTGTLTAWLVSVRAGDRICFDLNAATPKWYEVASIQSNTTLTLGNNFTGTSATVTGASGAFAIDNCSPDWSKPGDVALSVSRLLERITLLTQPAGPGDALKLARINAAGTAYELAAAADLPVSTATQAAIDARGFLDYTKFGAVGDGATNNDAAWTAWITALMSTGRPGWVPPGNFVHNSPREINLVTVAAQGVRIDGAGKKKAYLRFADGVSAPALKIYSSGSTPCFNLAIKDVSIVGSTAGVLVQIAKQDLTDELNDVDLRFEAQNGSTDAANVAVDFGGIYGGSVDVVGNGAGYQYGTAAMVIRQMQFCRLALFSGHSTHGFVVPGTGYVIGNQLLAVDFEEVTTCFNNVSPNFRHNAFLGGTFVPKPGAGGVSINSTAGADNIFTANIAGPLGTNLVGFDFPNAVTTTATGRIGAGSLAPASPQQAFHSAEPAGTATGARYQSGTGTFDLTYNTTAYFTNYFAGGSIAFTQTGAGSISFAVNGVTAINIDGTGVPNVTTPRLHGIPTYADNAAASPLAVGAVYRDGSGLLRIRY